MVWGNPLISLSYMYLSSFPRTTCWRECLFSTVYSCLLCCRLIDCMYVGLFWALCSVPLICKSHYASVKLFSLLSWLYQSSSIHSLSHVWPFATPWTAAGQASLYFTVSQSLLKLMSIELVMPSNHLIFFFLLLHRPSIFPSIRVFF